MKVVVYGRSFPACVYCENIKTLLNNKDVKFEYKDISDENVFEEYMSFKLRTVPALFIDDVYKGGFNEAKMLFGE